MKGSGLFAWPVLALAGLLTIAAGAQAAPPWHTPPDRWPEPRNYQTPFDPQYDGRLLLSQEKVNRPFALKVSSPNRAYWFGADPDWPRDPSPACDGAEFEVKAEDASFWVFTEREDLLKVTLKKHYPNFLIRVRWVNERLLYIRVWWGRIVGSCYLLDVEARRVVYREMVRSGDIEFQQFKEGGNR